MTESTARARAQTTVIGLAIAGIWLGWSQAPASAQASVPPRRGLLAIDSRQTIDRGALSAAYEAGIAEPFDLEGLVIVVDSCGPDPEKYFDEALMAYALAPRPGEMVDDAIAWLICADPPEGRFARSINNRYGTFLDPDTIELEMVDSIAAGELGSAAADGISAAVSLLERAPRSQRRTVSDEAELVPPAGVSSRPDGRDIALAALLVGLAGLGWRRRRRMAAIAYRAPAPKDLKRLRAATDDLSDRVLADSPLLTQLLAACEPLGEPARLALLRRHEAMSRRVYELRRQVEALEGRYAIRPDGGSDPHSIDAERRRLEDLLVEADALSGYSERIERELRHSGELHERAERFIEEARADVIAAREPYSRAAAPLADDPVLRLPDAFEATAFAEARISAAVRALSEGRRLQAGGRAEDVSDIVTRVARAAAAIGRAARRIDVTRARFQVFAEHAEASWWDVHGHGTEAEESLALAVELLRSIVHAPEAELGDDPAAGFVANIGRLDAEISRAIELCDILDARLADLEAARVQVESAIEPIRESVAASEVGAETNNSGAGVADGISRADWVERHARESEADPRSTSAQGSMQSAMLRARHALEDAEDALRAKPANWIAARHSLLVADRSAEEALSAALPPTEGSGRLARFAERTSGLRAARRRQIDLAQGDAEAEVGRAERFVQAHQGEIGPRALRRVEDARAALERALEARRRAEGDETGNRGDEAIAALRIAGEIAGDALRRLREAFERVEEPLSPSTSRRAGVGSMSPIQMQARHSPFPARFGDWGEVRPAATAARKGRWGARRTEGGHANETQPGW